MTSHVRERPPPRGYVPAYPRYPHVPTEIGATTMPADARPDHRAMAAARLVANLRARHPSVDRAWADAVSDIDGYPSTASGNAGTRGGNVALTTVEAAVAARERLTDARQEIHHWTHVILATRRDVRLQVHRHATRQQIPMAGHTDPLEAVAWALPRLELDVTIRADIAAGITLIAAAAHEALDACDRIEGRPRAARGQECYSGGRDGALIPYTPHSRDDDNGWADPDCRNFAAGYAPLCDACAQRERRWRRAHGYQPRDRGA